MKNSKIIDAKKMSNQCERLAAAILSAWCFLPVIISFFIFFMGLSKSFPLFPEDEVHAGNHYYPQTLQFYYRCFLILGVITLIFAVLAIGVSLKRILKIQILRSNLWIFLLLALLIWAAICSFLSIDFSRSFFGDKYMKDGLSSYFIYAGIFICASMIRTERARTFLLRFYCAVTVYLSLIMIVQEAVHGKIDYMFPAFRTVVFNQFNHFGYVLCMSVAAFAGLFIYDKTAGKGLKTFYIIGFCLVTYSLLINDTFGSFLASLIALPVILLFYHLNGNKLGIKAFLPCILFILISATSVAGLLPLASTLGHNINVFNTDVQNVAVGSEEADRAGTGRFLLWKDTIQRIKEHPVFGVGPEGLTGENAITNNDTPHNEYLQIAAYLGIPGLLLYLSALISLAAHHLKNIKKLDPMVLAVSGVTITYLISACFGNPLFNTYPYFWMFLGLTTATSESVYPTVSLIDTDIESLRQKPQTKRIMGLLLIAFVIITGLAMLYIKEERKIECQMEIIDLQSMRSAETTAKLRIKTHPEDAAGTYWAKVDWTSCEIIPDTEPMPEASGMGTGRAGGGSDAFKEDTGLNYDYDERVDYTDKIIKVTIDTKAPENEQIKLEWIEAAQ